MSKPRGSSYFETRYNLEDVNAAEGPSSNRLSDHYPIRIDLLRRKKRWKGKRTLIRIDELLEGALREGLEREIGARDETRIAKRRLDDVEQHASRAERYRAHRE